VPKTKTPARKRKPVKYMWTPHMEPDLSDHTYDFTTPRKPLLDFTTAIGAEQQHILSARGDTYADFSDNTQAMVDILRALGFQFPGSFSDNMIGALLHLAAKLSRIPQSSTHRDNWLDLANYAVLALAMEDRSSDRGPKPQ
jgi:hypothetical protein